MGMEPMSALLVLFDTVVMFGDIVGRNEAKDQEIMALHARVQSISASVRAFAAGLSLEEKRTTFNANKVFPMMLEQLQICDQVISKRFAAALKIADSSQLPPITDAQSAASSTGLVTVLSDKFIKGWKQGSNALEKWGREGLEAISGKLGSAISQSMRLPEDELAVIRNASSELERLVPLLQLAVTAHSGSRGQKRPFEDAENGGDLQRRRTSVELLPGPDAAGGLGLPAPQTNDAMEEEAGMVLQLVSDSPIMATIQALPALGVAKLRSAPSGVSTTSFESLASVSSDASPGSKVKPLVFGRQEVHTSVPRQFTLPHGGGRNAEHVHYSRFVSRDLFVVEELPWHPPASDSLEMPTLAMGGAYTEDSDTLPLGGAAEFSQPDLAQPALASVKCLCKAGLHRQSASEQTWRYVSQSDVFEMRDGDHIALLLESPPGSLAPGPQRDLQVGEATMLLGVRFQKPA